MPRWVPTTIAIASGLIVLAGYFIGDDRLGNLPTLLTDYATFLAAVALLMGALHLVAVHGRRVLKREANSQYSAALVIGLIATFAIGVLRPGSAALAWVFDYLYAPLQSTMTALLAFFIVSGAYRAFRLRSLEAVVLLISSLGMLLAQLPFSQRLSPYLPALRDWALSIPVTAGVRGILLGTALGTMATALRALTGIDRPYTQE